MDRLTFGLSVSRQKKRLRDGSLEELLFYCMCKFNIYWSSDCQDYFLFEQILVILDKLATLLTADAFFLGLGRDVLVIEKCTDLSCKNVTCNPTYVGICLLVDSVAGVYYFVNFLYR